MSIIKFGVETHAEYFSNPVIQSPTIKNMLTKYIDGHIVGGFSISKNSMLTIAMPVAPSRVVAQKWEMLERQFKKQISEPNIYLPIDPLILAPSVVIFHKDNLINYPTFENPCFKEAYSVALNGRKALGIIIKDHFHGFSINTNITKVPKGVEEPRPLNRLKT